MPLLSPQFITVVEPDVQSVAFYELKALAPNGDLITSQEGIAPDPSGTTVMHVGNPGQLLHAYVFGSPAHPELLGTQVGLQYRQIGHSGAASDWFGVQDAAGHGTFAVNEMPDGAASAIVTL